MVGPTIEQPTARTLGSRQFARDVVPGPRRRKSPNKLLRQCIERAGMTYEQVGDEVAAMALAAGERHIVPGRQRVGHWVNDGEQPKGPIPRYLAEIFTRRLCLDTPLTPSDLGLKHGQDSTGSERSAQPGGSVLADLGASLETVRSYTRAAAATDLRRGDTEDLELAVHQYATLYFTKSPAELWAEVAATRDRAASLLNHHRHTAREGRELSHHAGMLSVILAWIAHDLGDREYVEVYCDDAWEQGHQAGALEIGAWAEDVRCTDALYAARPLDALAAASRGLSVASPGSRVAVRLSAQLARANAALRRRQAFEEIMERVRRHKDRLPLQRSGLFGVDAAVIASYDASSHVWLGDFPYALAAALEAIERYEAAPLPHQAPTRLAIAQLDAALAHASLGDPDAAVALARQALSGERIVQSVRGRAEHLGHRLSLRYPSLPAVSDFNEECDQLRACPAPQARLA